MKKITNEEFNELKVLSLFLSIYRSGEKFNNIVPSVMTYTAKMFGETLVLNEIPNIETLESNFDIIKVLFTLTDRAYNGSDEAKEMALCIIEAIDINEIPKSARICVVLELKSLCDTREENIFKRLFETRERRVLKGLQDNIDFREAIDKYNLEFKDLGAYDWVKLRGKRELLKIEGYTGGTQNCAVYVDYNINTKSIIGITLNKEHPKVTSLISAA